MILDKIENKIIKDVFQEVRQNTLNRANLGVLKKDSNSKLIEALEKIPLIDLMALNSTESYDHWYDVQVAQFHNRVFPLYRENLDVSKDNPYTYSARMTTQYIKNYMIRSFQFNQDGVANLSIIHPIISNTFIDSFPELSISKVKEITTKQIYYDVVDYYRHLISCNSSYESKTLIALVELEDGTDV